MHTEHHFPDQDSLFSALHEFCVNALLSDLLHADQVSGFLSGGNTPRPLYHKLAETVLPWSRIHFALVDERWVPVNDPASNEGMLRTCFKPNPELLKNLVGMKTPDPVAAQAEFACNARYAVLPEPYSFCLLGMGNDGHTASLFPHADGLHAALTSSASCKALKALPSSVTGTHTERMSLTLNTLLRCRRIILLLTGAEKWQVYRKALHCEEAEILPVSAVLRQTLVPVDVFHCN